MGFAVGMLVGMFIMFAIAKRLQVELMRETEKFKDFETWKEWKNKL